MTPLKMAKYVGMVGFCIWIAYLFTHAAWLRIFVSISYGWMLGTIWASSDLEGRRNVR